MSTIKDEILSIATEQGYEGDAPQTIAGAVNALGTVIGGGGSGGGMVIHVTCDDKYTTYTADKTYEEILAYYEDGNTDIVLRFDPPRSPYPGVPYNSYVYYLSYFSSESGQGFVFTNPNYSTNTYYGGQYNCSLDKFFFKSNGEIERIVDLSNLNSGVPTLNMRRNTSSGKYEPSYGAGTVTEIMRWVDAGVPVRLSASGVSRYDTNYFTYMNSCFVSINVDQGALNLFMLTPSTSDNNFTLTTYTLNATS